MKRRRALCLFALLLVAAPSAAQEEGLLLDIRDAATGEPVTDLKCGLVAAASREVYARFEGVRYAGEPRPRAGDSLYVYRRGHDLLHFTIEEGVKRIEGRLVACTDSTTLVLEGEGTDDLQVQVSVYLRHPEFLRQGPILDHYDLVTRGSGLVIPMPRGMTVSPSVEPGKGILWPMFVPAPRNRPHVVRWDPPREIEVRFPEHLGPGDVLSFRFNEDHSWAPEVEPLRIDAWRGSFRARWVPGKEALEVVPPVAFHCLLQFPECFVYRYVGAGDEVIDLRKPFGPKRIAGRPIVDGQPVPEGTVLLPGRIDLATLELLAEPGGIRARHAGPLTEPWPEVHLAAAAWLTAWHPRTGLAHLEWPEGRAPEGSTYKGLVLVTAPPGFAVEGTVSVYPVWKGTGRVRSVHPDVLIRQSFDGSDRLRFPGLRPGRYGINVVVRLRAREGAEWVELRDVREIDVPEDHPTVVHRLEPR